MYLVYESLYGNLLCECESTLIVGLYDSKEKAVSKVKELIETEDFYVVDTDTTLEDNDYVRLFYNNQDNWSDYFEIIIKELELNKDLVYVVKEV